MQYRNNSKQEPTPSSSGVPIFRGSVEIAHSENLYLLEKSSIPYYWITASLSVVFFPITLILGEFILLRLPSTRTKNPFPVSNYTHFRQGARLGAGVGLSLLLFFTFVFRILLAHPTTNSTGEHVSSSVFITLASFVALAGSIFTIYKFVIQKSMKNAPKIVMTDSIGKDEDSDEETSFLPSSASSNDVVEERSLPPIASIIPTSNNVDTPSSMYETTAEELKKEDERRKLGLERTMMMTTFGSMLILIIESAVCLSIVIQVLQISQ